MSAAYDNYDYPAYWKGRGYEQASEFVAIKAFLEKISKVDNVIEIGAGFGRLLPSYSYRSKNILLTDPSRQLLSLAIKKYKNKKNIKFLQSKLENLLKKQNSRKFDLAIMVRVLHHIDDVDSAFKIIYKLLKPGGYFILEFPNKRHLKATLRNILKGDLTFPLNIFPVDLRSTKSIKNKTLPFINYHPDQIKEKLKECGFSVIETRSVSNIRSSFLKRTFDIKFLTDIESILQIPFSYLNFGPSIFMLLKKRV